MRKFYTVIFLLAATNGLAQEKEKDPFIGLDKKEIIEKYGKPTTVKQDGSKGEVLTYIREYRAGSAGSQMGIIRNDRYVFYIDRSGKVYSWKIGEKPRPKRSTDEMF